MKLDIVDAYILFFLSLYGGLSAYRLSLLLIDAGVVRVPPSGQRSVERSLLSRLKRLESLGIVYKDGTEYYLGDRVTIDKLKIVGEYGNFESDIGFAIVVDSGNGHYQIFEVSELVERIPEHFLQKLFSGADINMALATIIAK